jgi:hypothetical protein
MLLGAILIAAILTAFVVSAFRGMDAMWAKSAGERIAASEDAIRRAAVQCYALEGSYPPDLAYLADHYGIVVDESRYDYYYATFGSNIMPQVKVYPKTRTEAP